MLRFIQAADTKLFRSVFSNQGPSSLSKTARIISLTADGWLYSMVIPVLFLLQPEHMGRNLALFLAGFSAERTIYYSLKTAFKRRRPPNSLDGVESLITAADEFSLPSGHTSAAFYFVTFLCAGVSLVFLPLYLWAALVGLSRVILGVHFPTDILAGAVIGTTIALAIL